VLDFGCGDGDVLGALSSLWWTVGLERRLDDLALARTSDSLKVVAAEGSAPPFSRSFDMVGLFDVVEHVEDDRELLRRATALVSPGGWVLLTVPADPRLWSSLDTYAGHYRRYTRHMMVDLLTAANLRVERLLPLFRVLWPLGRLKAAFAGKTPIRDPEKEYRVPPLINRVLLSGLAMERTLAGVSPRGTGTSWLAAARVP
jgi:SAM-dependent methyltransferase